MVVGDITLADDTVHGTLVGVGAVTQDSSVMQPNFILCSRSQTESREIHKGVMLKL